ncbi:Transcription initiation factor TFIID subunit 12 [Extremus antarcticus]|uniref:Transcription initiation factor TFIID subunit 12 n=1 Tax=Extremus antarcticus TaxID=702011 RepID=A0AAJ0GIU6_9PEZI|nr:Transcription initiation factor TFIID subunit 12 [Extremus antarcticus]
MAQPNGGQSGVPPLIKPNQIDSLPHLNAAQKTNWKEGLTRLWGTLSTAPAGSPEYKNAETKIRELSMKVMQQMSSRPNAGGGQQQQQQQQRPMSQQGQGSMPQAIGMAQQGSQQGQQPQPPQMSQAVKTELTSVTINYPPEISQQGQAAMTQYRTNWYRRGASLLNKREGLKKSGTQLTQQRQSGQGDQQAIMTELNNLRAQLTQVQGEWDNMKAKMQQLGNQQLGQQPMQRQQQGSQGPSQQMNGGQQQQHSQQPQGDVKMHMDQGSAQSPQGPQGGFQQQPQTAQSQVAPTPQQQSYSQPPNSAHGQQQTPQSATQPQMPQNFPQQQNIPQPQQQQHPNQPQRPSVNTQHMQHSQQNIIQAQQQQQQQNHAAMPQSANQQHPPQQQQQPQQRPQPLSHQAAMSQAAESYSRAQAQQSQQQVPQMPHVPNGLPLNPPQSATQQTPTSGYPSIQQQTANSNSKWNTNNRSLQLDPRTQQPVQGQPSRPTYANAGMIAQPGVQRPAQFTLEGEGDRVLSKRKLDELVRQVTGTAAASEDANVLAPDVEESVLTLADNFVDNVITSACRLAKLRSSQTLDIRDIQIVLERNYGIRIPGYGLDEVRTVRKFQPAPGWQSKMQAVQAGKVMGGRDGKDS